jgi:competence protein ComGC
MKKAFKTFGIQEILIIVVFLIIFVSAVRTIDSFSERKSEDATVVLEEALMKASVQCYALEGGYPPNLDYLSDNYGIILDKEQYFYHYDIQGSNIAPNIVVIKR